MYPDNLKSTHDRNLRCLIRGTARFFTLLCLCLALSACGGRAIANETWALIQLLTKGERADQSTEVVEVRNCGVPENKTTSCSAGTSNSLSVSGSLGGSIEVVNIQGGLGADLGIGRDSGESVDLETPPDGYIYRYTVNKEYRVIEGQAVAKSSGGKEETVNYNFHASCSIQIVSRDTQSCQGANNAAPLTPPQKNTSAPLNLPTSAALPAPTLRGDKVESFEKNGRAFFEGDWNFIKEDGNTILDIQNRQAQNEGLYLGSPGSSDFIIVYRVKLLNTAASGQTVGLFFAKGEYKKGETNYSQGYLQEISTQADKMNLLLMKEDRSTYLGVQAFPFQTGRWYNIEIRVRGEQIEVSVDDKLVIQAADNAFRSGGISVSIGAGAHVQFDYILID